MERFELQYRNVRVIFIIVLTFMMTFEILIPSFTEDLSIVFIGDDKSRMSFKTDLYVSSIYTESVCIIGLFAYFKRNYKIIRLFNLLEGINCIFSLYISIRVFALTLLTVLNLTLLYVGNKYERHLKLQFQRNSTSSNNNNRSDSNIEITTISRTLQTTGAFQRQYSDPCPEYESPPAYSEELTQLPKIC